MMTEYELRGMHGMTDKAYLIPSASAILLRDDNDGLSVLLLKKNSNITFGGSWVFPGGRVDTSDSEPASLLAHSTERITVQRECKEETGLDITPSKLIPLSRWITPVIRPKRFTTLFFLYDANNLSKEVVIDQGEIVDAMWLSVETAIEAHQRKELVLAGPAFVTLSQLAHHKQTNSLIKHMGNKPLAKYTPRIQLIENGAISLYHADSAYQLLNDEHTSSDAALLQTIEQATVKQRLYMYKDQPWVYVDTFNI